MTIAYLQELGFKEEKEDINKLKISLGTVEFDENSKTFKITKPDLRYYWDGGRFGMHVSDWDFSTLNWIAFLKDNIKIVDKITVLYFGRTQVETFSILTYNFDSLEFLYLSENSILSYVDLKELDKLVKFEAALCPNLLKVEFTGNFGLLNSIDLSNSNLNTFSLQNADFPSLESINISGNPFKDKGIFTFHTAPVLHYVYGLKTMAGINQDHFEGSDLNVRKLVADELISDLAILIINPDFIGKELDLSKNYKLDNEDYIHFIDLGHLGLTEIPSKLLEIKTLKHLCLGAYYPDKFDFFGSINWQKSIYHEKTGTNFNIIASKELEKLKELPKLRSLFLNSIDLDSLDFLNSFPKLQSLDITGNSRLTNFNNLKDLKQLKLFHASSIKEFNDSQTKYLPRNLVSLSLENCGLDNGLFLKSLKKLKFLSVGNNEIQKIDLSRAVDLEYFMALGNPISLIEWPEKFSSITLFQISENKNINETLSALVNDTGDGLREKLNDFMKQNRKGATDTIIRVKLIFLGNTTVGKSTLRRILLSEEGKEFEEAQKDEDSTHGVTVFTKYFNFDSTSIYVQGFDFGGQDYYHATHLPFISHNALNLLVYGFLGKENEICEIDSAYSFGIKENEEGSEEITYPINYWIGSLKKNIALEFEDELELGEFLKHRTHEGKKYALDGLTVELNEKPRVVLGETRVELIQNTREDNKYQELNNLDIIQKSDVSIRGINSFNFLKKADVVKEWLREKILSHATTSPFLYTDKKLIDWLEKQNNVIFTIQEIFQLYEHNDYETEKELSLAIQRIHIHNFGYYFETSSTAIEPFFINKLQEFSNWIHKSILTKKLYNELNGYFKLSDLELSDGIEKHRNQIFQYLEEKNIIFKVEGEGIEIDKWVAPTYLPSIETRTEELLIDSFEDPDCKFEFKGFFHSNIILMLIKEFKEELILDVKQKEYLLWKNKVVLHQKGGKDSKAYLLVELKYPGENSYYPKFPQLSISRNVSGFVNDSTFQKVFKYVNEQLLEFKPEISIKTRYGDYIPYEAVISTLSEEKDKKSPFVYSNGVLYPKYDFRLYGGDSFDAPLKIFIAYSKFDDVYRLELRDHLTPGINEGKFIVFDDREMDLGEKWRARLKKELEQCDVFILLLSVKTLGTAYVMNTEIPAIKKRHEDVYDSVKIIPIMVSPCDWSKTGLSEYNANDKAQSITLKNFYGELGVNERANKWQEIVQELDHKLPINTNEPIPPISPPPPNEHPTGYHQTDGGE